MKTYRFLIPVLATAFLVSLFIGNYASADSTTVSDIDAQPEVAVAKTADQVDVKKVPAAKAEDSLESYEVRIHRGILERSL